jgi:hypothetical protein
MKKILTKLNRGISNWLTADIYKANNKFLTDFERLSRHIKPADIILVEGRSRASKAIRAITQSAWTHSALYIGTINEMSAPQKKIMTKYYQGTNNTPLIIESNMGTGVTIEPLSMYKNNHLRICRPEGLNQDGINTVIDYSLSKIGHPYDNQQIFDLVRFFIPWWVLPTTWRSSLFKYHAGGNTKLTCSLLITEAFYKAKFPILPVITEKTIDSYFQLIQRNPRLMVPCDFDYSPFFKVIKYPIIDLKNMNIENYIWQESLISNDEYGFTSKNNNQ